MTLTSIALWALVLSLGFLTASAVFEARVVVPLWANDPPASLTVFHAQPRKPDAGRRLWIFLTPASALISLFNLVLALMSHEVMRGWWIASSGAIVVVIAITFAYFVPELLSFEREAAQPPTNIARRVRRWAALNLVRALIIFAAWITALRVFASIA